MPGGIHDFTTAEIKVKKRQIGKKKKNMTAVDSLIWTGKAPDDGGNSTTIATESRKMMRYFVWWEREDSKHRAGHVSNNTSSEERVAHASFWVHPLNEADPGETCSGYS